MARRSFVRGGGRSRVPSRQTFWVGSADTSATTALAAAAVSLDQIITEAVLQDAGLLPSTVIRTRGELWVRSDQVAAAEEPFGGLAFSVVDTPAQTAGVTSLSTPINEESNDGFFTFVFWHAGTTNLAAGSADAPWSRYSFDSKAMRKVQPGQAVVAVMENAHGTHGVSYILKFRMLFKLG